MKDKSLVPKGCLIILLFVGMYFHTNAQIHFLDPDTAVWRFRGFVHFGPCFHHDWQFMLSNQDTIAGNHTYRKMYQLGHELVYLDCIEPPLGSTVPQSVYPFLAGLIREEGRKVYYWPTSYDSEFLAYDFDQQVGDTIPLYASGNVVITSIEDIVLNGQTHKQYIIGWPGNTVDTIIEGIGTISFPFLPSLEAVHTVNLVCYSRNGSVFYNRNDSCGFYEYPVITGVKENGDLAISDPGVTPTIYPNPATNELYILTENKDDYTVQLFDHLGRIQKVGFISNITGIHLDISTLSSGVYFISLKNKEMRIPVQKLVVVQ